MTILLLLFASVAFSQDCPTKLLAGLSQEKTEWLPAELKKTPNPQQQIALIYWANKRISKTDCSLSESQNVYTTLEFAAKVKEYLDAESVKNIVDAHNTWAILRALDKMKAVSAEVNAVGKPSFVPINGPAPTLDDSRADGQKTFHDEGTIEATPGERGPALEKTKKTGGSN